MGVASLPPSLIPALQNIGILHHKTAKLPKHLQHSVHTFLFRLEEVSFVSKIGCVRTKEVVYRKSHGILPKWSIVSS